MSRVSIVLLVCSFAAAVVSGARTDTKGAVCSVTEAVDDPQYDISFEYDTEGECSDAKCNNHKFFDSELKKVVSGAWDDDKKYCVCTGNLKEMFRFRPLGTIKKCDTDSCWDDYSYQLRKMKYKDSDAPQWLTSPNHWVAQCKDGQTNLPSIKEHKAGMTPGIVPENREDGDAKNNGGYMEDDGLEDLEDLEEEEGSLDQEEKDCPDLAAVVSDTEARTEAETRTIAGYRTVIHALETEVPDLETTTKQYETQRDNFKEYFERLVVEGGSRTCSITENNDHDKFDVSFAYGMQRACTKIQCSLARFWDSQLEKIVKGTEKDKRCTCTLEGKVMFSYKIGKYNPCASWGCWKLYTSIRNIAVKYGPLGEYPDAGASLDSTNHYDATCDAEGKTRIPAPSDVARKLKEDGNDKAANEMMKLVTFDETVEEELTGETFQSDAVQNDLADGQKTQCAKLAAKLAQAEAELEDREGVSQQTRERTAELEGRKAELIALKDNIETEIKEVAKLMSAKERATIDEGPVDI